MILIDIAGLVSVCDEIDLRPGMFDWLSVVTIQVVTIQVARIQDPFWHKKRTCLVKSTQSA
jgi:hypothetical protein